MFYLPKIIFLEKGGGEFYAVSDGRTTQLEVWPPLDLVEYIHCARKSVGYSAFGMGFHNAPQMCNNLQMEALLFSIPDLLPITSSSHTKVMNHRNHKQKRLIHESALQPSQSSPLHHAVHTLTSRDQDDAS